MVIIKRQIFFLPYGQVWFAKAPQKRGFFPPLKYFQCPTGADFPGFSKHEFHTLIHDLRQEPTDLLSVMNSSTRNEIRQMEKKDCVGEFHTDIEGFLEFFNSFCQDRGIPGTTLKKLKSIGESLVLTKATLESRTLAQHAFICDREVSRVRLLFSASARFQEGMEKNDIGKGNRFLHFWEMQRFKELGYFEYDWGGVAVDTEDPGKVGVNKFKEAFGGVPRIEFNYTPSYLKGILKE